MNTSEGNFFSNNVAKTYSYVLKIPRNIEIKYLFHFKAYFGVHDRFLTSCLIRCSVPIGFVEKMISSKNFINYFTAQNFSVFGVILVRIRYGVFLQIQYECGKMWTRILLNTDTFHAVPFYNAKLPAHMVGKRS